MRLGNILKSNLKVGAAQTDLFDELLKNYLTGGYAASLEKVAKTEKLVGPIAKLERVGTKEINPIEIAAQYRANPDEKLINKLNTIEIAVDFGTASKMGIIGPKGNSLPNLFAETVTGIISPQTYVSSTVRVLPGGAIISTDPAFIEAYGFPKVLPYMVEPTGDAKNPFRLKSIEVPERGVETPTSNIVPTKAGGKNAKNIDYRREQLLREARGNKSFEDISFKAEALSGGLPKGRENTFETDRLAKLDFIISQIDILAETPSSWTSKEIFDQSMKALRENMTETDFKNMIGTSIAGGAGDIISASPSSRWNLSKRFNRLIAMWDSPERDIMFADASRRWTAISGKQQYTNFAEGSGGAYPVEPTTTEAEKMAGTDFSQPEVKTVKKPEKYIPVDLVRIRDENGKPKLVSAASDEARKYYLDNGEVLATGRNPELYSKDTLVSKATDVTAKYPTIFAGDRSQAIDDLLVATDEISRLAYRLAYALGYGTDLKPLGTEGADVRTMQAIASTVSSLIDEEHYRFAETFKAPTSLSRTNYDQPIIPDFRRQAETHLRVLETLQKQLSLKEVVDPETGLVLQEKPVNVPDPLEVKSFQKKQLEARIAQIEQAAGGVKDARELAILKRQYEALLRGERVPNYQNILRDVSTVTVKADNTPDVTAKLGMGIKGDPVEEIASRLAATMIGDEDPAVLRNVLGQSKILDLFNEGPEAAAAAIIKRAWVLYGENATPDLMRELSFNYNGREYYGTMGVGPDGRPIMAVQPVKSSEPTVASDTAARKALIAQAETASIGKSNVIPGAGVMGEPPVAGTMDEGVRALRVEDNKRMVVIRRKQQWNAISDIILQLFSEIDKGKLDSTVKVFVNDLLSGYVKPDGTPVTYEDVVSRLDYAELVKSGPYNITHRLFDHGINGNFKDIEKFVRYTQDTRERGDTVALGGRYARDLGIDPETGRVIVGGADIPEGEIDARTQSELNTERSTLGAELRTGPLPEEGGFHPEVGSPDHNAMMAYEQGKMFGGLGLPWTKALSDIGRPLREAPGSMKAFHGRGGFGAGFAADAAYMAWKGYLDPTSLAVSAGFNSINFLPAKYAPKVGLIGAAANLGLTAVTGGDMGRAA
ncbi:MAG: hypothetical protein EBR82_42390 [Caulobacteraceae bacterium]|nr:hypothetical protein [Caulobacteraceae bacterium]